ncbi:hypothetical protein PSTG_12797, partial [Puccinia striiformis f. sp. tritici PST-78]
AHGGALYLGVNAWQLPNGYNILGTVIYWLAEHKNGQTTLEVMLLDFVLLAKSHTSEYLANTVRLVVGKFGIQNKLSICGIVSDKTKNKKSMGILRPFGSHKKNGTAQAQTLRGTAVDTDNSTSKDNDNPEEQIRVNGGPICYYTIQWANTLLYNTVGQYVTIQYLPYIK